MDNRINEQKPEPLDLSKEAIVSEEKNLVDENYKKMIQQIVELKSRDVLDDTIKRRLVSEGNDPEKAAEAIAKVNAFVQNNKNATKQKSNVKAILQLIGGLLLIIVGIAITAASDGQRLFYGLVLVGIVTAIRGVISLVND